MNVAIASHLREIDNLGRSLPSGTKWDAEARSNLRRAAQRLVHELEEPSDIVERVCFQALETAQIRIGVDLGIFRMLAESDTLLGPVQLADRIGADPVLLERVLRALASIGAISEVGEGSYISNKTSETFAIPQHTAEIKWYFDFLTPVWNHLPKWLAQTKYRTPVDSAHTAFHHVYKTSEDSQTFISKHPEYNNHSASNLGGTRTSWIDIYPIQDKLKDEERKNETSSTFVEIGGGLQREVSTLISRFPHLSLFVLQHSPAAVSNLELDGIEVIAHDILEPQPIRGARFYYLRHILYRSNDLDCIKILDELRLAMTPSYSRLLISEHIVPAEGASTHITHQDFNTMALTGGSERTEKQWRALLEKAGLEIKQIWQVNGEDGECLIEAMVSETGRIRNLLHRTRSSLK
ncbi:hypothetical protein MMC14_008011 [Varicellaria rhodocarpa]|nr:hypothetical protein [Varicellaria rhodocarpa]